MHNHNLLPPISLQHPFCFRHDGPTQNVFGNVVHNRWINNYDIAIAFFNIQQQHPDDVEKMGETGLDIHVVSISTEKTSTLN